MPRILASITGRAESGVAKVYSADSRLCEGWCEQLGRPYDSVLRTHVTLPLIIAETRSAVADKLDRYVPPFVRQITTESIVAGTPSEVIAHYAPWCGRASSTSWRSCTGTTSTSACSWSGSFRSCEACRQVPSPEPTGVADSVRAAAWCPPAKSAGIPAVIDPAAPSPRAHSIRAR